MERTAPPRVQTKGVEFSDHLTVFGPPSYGSTDPPSHGFPPYVPPPVLPKARVFVHRGAAANQDLAADPYSDPPEHPRSLSEHFDHTPIDEERPLSNTPSMIERWEGEAASEGYFGLGSQFVTESYPESFHHASYDSLNLRTGGKRRARFFHDNPLKPFSNGMFPEDERVETCTDSDISGADPVGMTGAVVTSSPTTFQRVISDECTFEESTRINTKLNSLPSGGAFSLMNSSEDITASRASSQSSTDDDLRSSRKMIRVDGSAKLSSASGLDNEDDLGDEDEFGIEDAEPVDEEEAVQVRSFGRSFAKVCLRDGEDVIIRDPRRVKKRQSEVAFSLEAAEQRSSSAKEPEPKSSPADLFTDDDDTYRGMFSSKSTPPRRRSKVRITFNKGTAKAKPSKNSSPRDGSGRRASRKESRGSERREDVTLVNEDSDQEFSGMTCFRGRKLNTRTSRHRVKSNTTELGTSTPGGAGELSGAQKSGIRRHGTVSVVMETPAVSKKKDDERRKDRKQSRQMVKNVSLQRDDWIEFATSGTTPKRPPWVVRLLSSNGNSPSVSPSKRSGTTATTTTTAKESKRAPGPTRRRSIRSFWKRWGRK